MDVYFRVLFISHKVDSKTWSQAWWAAKKFSTTVKTGTVNGYFYLPHGSAVFRQKIDANNVTTARRFFGGWLLRLVEANATGKELSFVPIPSTDAIVGRTGDHRHAIALSQAIAPYVHKHEICDVLRFTEALEKASHGGPRYEHEVYPKLTLVGEPPKRPVVLIDDILTSGGHMKACKKILEETGCEVLFGIVCGRTTEDLKLDPWEPGKEVLVTDDEAIEDWLNSLL